MVGNYVRYGLECLVEIVGVSEQTSITGFSVGLK